MFTKHSSFSFHAGVAGGWEGEPLENSIQRPANFKSLQTVHSQGDSSS